MRVYYSDHFPLPLPENHRFPMAKYRLLRNRVEAVADSLSLRLAVPPAATDHELLRVHTSGYVRKVAGGDLTPSEIRRIGFPWSPQMEQRARRSAGATLGAARSALQEGLGVNLAGGTHHAFADRGAAFCVFNDSAIAASAMLEEGRAERIAVVDCDVHQGDGTAFLGRNIPEVFTLSIHGANNFPFRKESSDIDIALDDETEDLEYLARLEGGLEVVFRFCPDLVIYLAGADPFVGDRLGRLSLSKKGLLERDRLVLESCRSRGIAVAVTMAGGYADRVEDIVDIHFQTVQLAARLG